MLMGKELNITMYETKIAQTKDGILLMLGEIRMGVKIIAHGTIPAKLP